MDQFEAGQKQLCHWPFGTFLEVQILGWREEKKPGQTGNIFSLGNSHSWHFFHIWFSSFCWVNLVLQPFFGLTGPNLLTTSNVSYLMIVTFQAPFTTSLLYVNKTRCNDHGGCHKLWGSMCSTPYIHFDTSTFFHWKAHCNRFLLWLSWRDDSTVCPELSGL